MNLLSTIGDSHCHLDLGCNKAAIDDLSDFLKKDAAYHETFFHIMSTNHLDIELVERLTNKMDYKSIIPYFGIHPWYSHLFTQSLPNPGISKEQNKIQHYKSVFDKDPPKELLDNLPTPFNLEAYLKKVEKLIYKYELCGVGEIGLDKQFKVPSNGYYGNPNISTKEVTLSNCRVKMSHQKSVLAKQLELANKYEKQISLHCVQGHGLLFELVSKYSSIPSIILHSYSGSKEQAITWIKYYKNLPQNIYFSLSNCINGNQKKRESLSMLLQALDDRHILVETDLSIDKFILSGRESEYIGHLESIFAVVCEIKGWDMSKGKSIIFDNLKSSFQSNIL